MQLQLYRPILWWDGEVVRCVDALAQVGPYNAAVLIALRHVGVALSPNFISGEFMSDDTSFALQLVTAPASEPITLSQAKAFLRIDDGDTADDAAVTTAITAARQFAEHYLRKVLLPQVWDYSVANPCTLTLNVPLGPVQSITSVTLTDVLGNVTTLNSGYRVSVDGFTILFTNLLTVEKLTVRFSASAYANVSAIPAPIIQGMLHHIAGMMENRDGVSALPVQSVNCYQPFRRIML